MTLKANVWQSNFVHTRVKICGITQLQDALFAAQLGVDALGLVFYDQSPRNISLEQAQIIVNSLPPFVTVVGLFVNPEFSWVQQVLARVHLDLLQFHGEESSEYCTCFGRPYIKALRMQQHSDIENFIHHHPHAKAILLDSYLPGVQGGTGITFDWHRIPAQLSKPIILAGGLTPENVPAAITTIHPYAVDVSGGVESAKGIKDHAKMIAFLQEVRTTSSFHHS